MDLMAILEARDFLENSLDEFPKLYCDIAVRSLNEIFGFERKAGVYVPTDSYHAWNYIPEDEMNLCITISQFDLRYG